MLTDHSNVGSREDLVAYINRLRDEYRADPEAWENNSLERFLDALAAWIDDSPGYWSNIGQPNSEQPDWSWVALALRAATLYE